MKKCYTKDIVVNLLEMKISISKQSTGYYLYDNTNKQYYMKMGRSIGIHYINRKDDESMSTMIIMRNQYGTVITADSRLNTEYNGFIEHNDNFQKVFFNRERMLIWGITGYYGHNNDFLKKLNKIFHTVNIKNISEYIKIEATKIPKKAVVNIFYAMPHCAFVCDIIENNVIENKFTMLTSQAGIHNFMISSIPLQQIKDFKKDDMIRVTMDLCLKEMKIDQIIHNMNKNFNQSIGGDFYSVFMESDGYISTYINGKEKNFQ